MNLQENWKILNASVKIRNHPDLWPRAHRSITSFFQFLAQLDQNLPEVALTHWYTRIIFSNPTSLLWYCMNKKWLKFHIKIGVRLQKPFHFIMSINSPDWRLFYYGAILSTFQRFFAPLFYTYSFSVFSKTSTDQQHQLWPKFWVEKMRLPTSANDCKWKWHPMGPTLNPG